MQIMIANESRDEWETFDVIDVKREGESLVIVTPPLTFIIAPLNEFAEKVVDLIGPEDSGRDNDNIQKN